ncbi:uncharacterized protein LOC128224122 [Mya arenaria]|uniref:uncharacterized protein LOC128224122 n=1 Tax=Mya arenaria TaxID=6604 RepID=UPI0022E68984|nr:uncharacterized protein LOC128224122 [Mya arenaria]
MSFVKNDIKEVLDEYVLLKKSVSETTSAVDVSMFGESNGLADVTLVVEGRRIPVTKAVLAFSSPVFLAMFQSDFKEKEKSEIPLPDKKLPAFVMFLRCLYPNIMEKVTAESVYDVIYLANEYQTEHLRIACEQVMVKELFKWEDPTSPGCCLEVYRHLAIAETCQLDELRARCIGIAAEATQKDRESAATVYPISEKMERIVEKQTIKKHEINTADLKDLLNGFGGKKGQTIQMYIQEKLNIQPENKTSGIFGSTRPSGVFSQKPPSPGFGFVLNSTKWSENLQKLRWVYQYAETSGKMKKAAITQVRNDREAKEWKAACQEQFELLPEKIKHDIRGREIMQY